MKYARKIAVASLVGAKMLFAAMPAFAVDLFGAISDADGYISYTPKQVQRSILSTKTDLTCGVVYRNGTLQATGDYSYTIPYGDDGDRFTMVQKDGVQSVKIHHVDRIETALLKQTLTQDYKSDWTAGNVDTYAAGQMPRELQEKDHIHRPKIAGVCNDTILIVIRKLGL